MRGENSVGAALHRFLVAVRRKLIQHRAPRAMAHHLWAASHLAKMPGGPLGWPLTRPDEARYPRENLMIAFTRRSLARLPAIAPLLSSGIAHAMELNSAAVTFKLPDQIQQVHFDSAKAEDAVLLIVGEGPGTSTLAEVK